MYRGDGTLVNVLQHVLNLLGSWEGHVDRLAVRSVELCADEKYGRGYGRFTQRRALLAAKPKPVLLHIDLQNMEHHLLPDPDQCNTIFRTINSSQEISDSD